MQSDVLLPLCECLDGLMRSRRSLAPLTSCWILGSTPVHYSIPGTVLGTRYSIHQARYSVPGTVSNTFRVLPYLSAPGVSWGV